MNLKIFKNNFEFKELIQFNIKFVYEMKNLIYLYIKKNYLLLILNKILLKLNILNYYYYY